MKGLSVVIPTYNRGPRLRSTVEGVLGNRIDGTAQIEILVVDDGSTPPVDSVLHTPQVPSQVTLRVIRQANSGPAKARNAGFRASGGDIVLFMDDDILPPPDLLRRHAQAHRDRPGCVICGPSNWVPPESPGVLFGLLQQLAEGHPSAADTYAPVPIVASGHLSVERSMFDRTDGVYRDDLMTPAAEEYELSARLRRRQIPILFVKDLVALHDASTALPDVCRQQYKHGLGCGEVARRCPETLELSQLAGIVGATAPKATDDLSTAPASG